MSREALAEFREATRINPNDGFSYIYVGMILCFVEKKYAEAWDAVQQAQKLGAYVAPSFLEFLKTKIYSRAMENDRDRIKSRGGGAKTRLSLIWNPDWKYGECTVELRVNQI